MAGLQPTLAPALLPCTGIQPPLVAILLHDKQLSKPTTTDLRVASTQHKGFSSISAPMGLQQRGMSPSPFFPYHPDSTCEGENKREKKKQKPQPHWGRMYKPTGLWVSFTGNFITVLQDKTSRVVLSPSQPWLSLCIRKKGKKKTQPSLRALVCFD